VAVALDHEEELLHDEIVLRLLVSKKIDVVHLYSTVYKRFLLLTRLKPEKSEGI
jgi:hypothetical protein